MESIPPVLLARQPQVITGMRGAGDAPDVAKTFTAPVLEVPEGQRIFRSRYRRYRLHLGKRPDKWNNNTSSMVPGFEFTAVFDEYQIVIPRYFEGHNIPPEDQEEFVKRLERHPAKGRDYFEIADLVKARAESEETGIREALLAKPELMAKLVAEEVQRQGFQLPKKQKKGAAVESEPELEKPAAIASSDPITPVEEDKPQDPPQVTGTTPAVPAKRRGRRVERY